ncbi:alpha/beta hydrolase family protein [Actomonas aquatica]|uniref:Alpha/beta fold hydrolase n=1 Tax=Actomonas aquatica TaxID=2866162 RepID=A0ABZ1C8R2_9BACT|nr:alpha/beta fold hydrolase [Opitutus sp. WL0086]WRQ87858.1 alpha/beta fold hydrolase [Opitutus sp. WL0086]
MPATIRPVRSALRQRSLTLLIAVLAGGFAAVHGADDPTERATPVPADQPIPVTDFFRPWLFSQPALNGKGTHVAAVVPMSADRKGLLFVELEKNKIKTVTPSANRDVASYVWLNDKRVLLTVVEDNLYASGLYIAEPSGKSFSVEQNSACQIIGLPLETPDFPLVWVRRNAYDDGRDYGVVQINTRVGIRSRREEHVLGGTGFQSNNDPLSTYGIQATVKRTFPKAPGPVVTSYFTDRLGELAFATTASGGRFTLHYLEQDEWHESPADLDEIYIIGAGDDPGELIVMGPTQAGSPRALHRFDARSGQLGEMVYQDDAYDPESASIIRDPRSRRMIGLRIDSVATRTVWFDETMRQVQAMVEQSLPRQIVLIVDMDEEGRHFILASYSDKQPPIFHVLDLKKKSLGLLKQSAPWIDPDRSAPMHIIQFKARDGVKLEGFLTIPPAASEANPVPLVVLPHGGPWANDIWGWDPEVQFLASRGYAVFQPNYRGSTGYDWKFPGDTWDFAKMHHDVTDGVKALRKMSLIDPDRIAIMGSSFGGYLALTGATQEPDLYRCAISNAGVFDWQELIDDMQRFRFEDARYQVLRRNLLEASATSADLEAISPLNRIDQIKIPVFVAHGKKDTVVSIRQSKHLVDELEKNHIPHEVLFAGGEGHGMEQLRNLDALYSRIEAFLAKHL